jgi:serine/threonine-protein kinase
VDVYQLGCVLYECLTCSLPFGEEGAAMDVLHAHLNAPPPRVSEANPHLPAALDEVIATAMAKNPAHRFESCSQLIAAAGEAAGLMTAAAPAPVAGGAPMPAEGPLGLQVTQGNAQGSQILVEDELIIGRLAEDEGRLADDPELSRRHARIFRADDGSWAIEDLGSTNGTFVNGSSVDAPTPLSLSDVISVGNTALVVEAAAAEPPEAAAAEPPEAAAAEPPDLATFPETAEAAVSAPEPAPPAEPEAAPEPAPAPEPEPPEPPGAPEPAPAAPPLAIRVEVDPEAGEARLWLDDETEPVLLRAKGGRWRVVDD